MNQPKHPLLRFYGGKWRLAPWIISCFDSHKTYVEPFGGGANVLLRKVMLEIPDNRDTPTNIYNEYDTHIFSVLLCVKTPHLNRLLCAEIADRPYCTETLKQAYASVGKRRFDLVQCAADTLTRSYLGFHAGATTGLKTGLRGIRPGNSPDKIWQYLPILLKQYQHALQKVELHMLDYHQALIEYDSPNTLFYLDPPYPSEMRSPSCQAVYRHEMTTQDHIALLHRILQLQGQVIISTYNNPLYNQVLSGWSKITKNAATASRRGSASKQEVLFIKP